MPGDAETGGPPPRLPLPATLLQHAQRRPRPTRRSIVLSAASFVLLAVLIGGVLPALVDSSWGQILVTLGSLPAWVTAAAVLLGLFALAVEALTVPIAVRGARVGAGMRAYAVSTLASTTIPGGGVLGSGLMVWMLHRAGISVTPVLIGIAALSVTDIAVSSLVVPVAGLLAYVLAGADMALPGTMLAAGGALLLGALSVAAIAVVLSRPVLVRVMDGIESGLANVTGAGDRRIDDRERFSARTVLGFRDELVALLRRRGLALLGVQVLSRVLHAVVLVLVLRALGVELPLMAIVAVFALGRLVSLIPLTPGGAGITETVSAAALMALGAPGADAAAATLVLMVATVIVPVLAGGLTAAVEALRPRAHGGASGSHSVSS